MMYYERCVYHASHLLRRVPAVESGCLEADVGGIEDLARDKGFKSLRDVGIKITPEQGEHKPAYIANKVRELDRGKDLSWWTGTGKKYWQALAELLEVRESELIETVKQSGAEDVRADATNLWVFGMFPGLGALDLASERLFPGLPAELTHRGGPQLRNTWWVAPGGAGKTLLGRWLEVNFGWTAVKARTWAEAVPELPESGRVYLELDSAVDAPINPDLVISQYLRLCVAVAAEPPVEVSTTRGRRRSRVLEDAEREPPAEAKRLWRTVRSPPADQWLLPLVDWVAGRLRRPEGFVPDEIRAMVAGSSLREIVGTPGEALDLFGVIDVVGFVKAGRERGHVDRLRWVKEWVSAAADRADRAVPRGMEAHLRKRGVEVLLTAVQRRLRDGLGSELVRSEWVKLVPADHAADTDYSEIYELAERGDLKALEEIRLRLRPDGPSWVAAFESIGLLAETDHGLVVRPEWLSRVVEGHAFGALMEDVPRGLGALLLHRDTAEQALDRLVSHFSAGDFTKAEGALACADPASPETLALLDGVVRAAGLTADSLPVELARRLWEGAMQFTEQRWPNLPPIPILGLPAPGHWHGPTSLGAWFLSMLALSRRAGGTSMPKTALDPWSGITMGPETERLVEGLSRAAAAGGKTHDRAQHDLLTSIACRLGGALLDAVGVFRRHNRVSDAQVADVVVALSSGRDLGLTDDERRDALQLRCGLKAVRDTCTARDADLGAVLSWCWLTWAKAQDDWAKAHNELWPPYSWIHQTGHRGPAPPDAQAVWRALPPALLNDELCGQIARRPGILPFLTEPVWERWLATWASKKPRWDQSDRVFEDMPVELAVRAVVEGHVDPSCAEIRRILWARIPERLVEVIDAMALEPPRVHPKLPDHRGPLPDLVWSAPDERAEVFVGRAKAWLGDPARYPGGGDWVWPWLLSVVEGRRPGWRDAFALLSERRRGASGKGIRDGGRDSATAPRRASPKKTAANAISNSVK